MTGKKLQAVDDYINNYPPKVQKILKQIRATVRKAAPGAAEKITYGIPTLMLNGHLVHFAAFKNHISFFPASSGVRAFKKELAEYKISTGTIQFSFDQPLPLALISKIVKFRVGENSKARRARRPIKTKAKK